MKRYLWNLFISVDQFINVLGSPIFNLVITGKDRFGNPDETLSSVMGKNIRNNKCLLCHLICGILNRIDKGHCKNNIEDDE